jgi:hypothetical protein
MVAVVGEKYESRKLTSGETPAVELVYWVSGTEDDQEAHFALAAVAPAFYGSLARQSVHVEPVGGGLWEGVARYGRKKPKETGDSSFSFDTGGGTQHITQSIETVGKHGDPGLPGPAPDFGGAIGVTHDNVEGVDITVPVYNFSETHYIAVEFVTPTYKAALFRLTGKVNSGVFRGFQPGEVLFQGASGTQRGEEDWEISFRFAASPNAVGLKVGDIAGINKKGWEYLWVRYADAEDEDAKVLVKRPIAAYVEQVYEYGDFSELGIGT